MTEALPDNLRLPRPAREFLPHRPPMQLVDRLLSAEDGTGTVEVVPGPDCPLLGADGGLETVALVELLAQGYAAVQGYIDRCAGRPPGRGFLVGIRRAQLYAPARRGDRLLVTVRTVARLERFAMVEGEVRCGDSLLGSAVFKLWLPGEAA
jgi:predicted hotdog family 3-hydroxylacyl-ACP dehydratase